MAPTRKHISLLGLALGFWGVGPAAICGVPARQTPVRAPAVETNAPSAKATLAALWRDPTFQKQFVGTYGISAEIEPRVTPEEVALLERIRPLMGTDLRKAAQMLEREVKPDSSAMLDFNLGSIYFQQDQMDKALRRYRRAVGKFPSFRRAHRNLGMIHVRNGKYDEAIASFTRMIELGGGDAYSYGLLAFAYAAKEDYLAAEAAYRNALLLQPDNTEWRLGLTRCVFKQQKFEDAVSLLDALIQRYPEKPEFWLLQANAYLGLKQPLKAAVNLECLDRMRKATPENLVLLGDLYLSEDLVDLAAQAYGLGLSGEPPLPTARAIRCAHQLAAKGAFAQARVVNARLRELREKSLEPSERAQLAKLDARIAMAKGEDGPELVRALEETLKLNPLDGDALMLMAQYYTRKNESEHAILNYERAAEIPDFEVQARTRHAQLLVSLGRFNDALPLLRRAQEVKPREEIARYIEQVERIARSKR
jgi:tetratricopeptide (TPR) repeat protein